MIQRLNDTQFLTDIDSKTILETSWHDLTLHRVINATIDVTQNMVSGSTQSNLFSYGETYTVRVEPRAEGNLVSVSCVSNMPGTIDFGSTKKKAAITSQGIEAILAWGPYSAPTAVESMPPIPSYAAVAPVAPIASPTDEGTLPRPTTYMPRMPVYGPPPPILRGGAVLTYGIVGFLCCQIAAPFGLYVGIKALKEYGGRDPGDRTSVIVGLVFASLGTAYLVLRVGLLAFFWLHGSF